MLARLGYARPTARAAHTPDMRARPSSTHGAASACMHGAMHNVACKRAPGVVGRGWRVYKPARSPATDGHGWRVYKPRSLASHRRARVQGPHAGTWQPKEACRVTAQVAPRSCPPPRTFVPSSCAMPSASAVLPVPGAPVSSRALRVRVRRARGVAVEGGEEAVGRWMPPPLLRRARRPCTGRHGVHPMAAAAWHARRGCACAYG